MTKMIERLRDKLFTRHLTSRSTLGRRYPRKVASSARVDNPLLPTNLIYIELLEKSRHKRPVLEEVLNHPWFAEFEDIHNMRKGAAEGEARFMAFTLTEPNSPKLKEEMDRYGGGGRQ